MILDEFKQCLPSFGRLWSFHNLPKTNEQACRFFVVFIFHFTFELRVELRKPFAEFGIQFQVKLTQGVLQRLLHQFCRCLQIIGALGFTFSQKDLHSE